MYIVQACITNLRLSGILGAELSISVQQTNCYYCRIGKLNSQIMTSRVRTITSPFKKACTFLHHQPSRGNKSHQGHENRMMDLRGEVMACSYEDVQVMWSILDKSKPTTCNLTH